MKSGLLGALALGSIAFSTAAMADTVLVVRTSGNVAGAGTDSNIYVRLSDSDNTSRRLRLQDLQPSGNLLESGAVEAFQIKDPGLDTAILSIQVESDGQYSGADWHLESMTAISFDPANIEALATWPIVMMQVTQNTYDAAKPQKGVLVSSFLFEDWVKGDSTYMAENKMQPGVLLTRKEPIVKAVGKAESVPTTLYVLYSADALDSDQPVERAWETTISRTESLTFSDEKTDQGTFGIEATAGYAAGDGGGFEASATLKAEYQFVIGSTKEQVWGSEVSTATNDTFEAEAGTIQFRILSTSGIVAQQSYVSLIQDQTFLGRYVQEASPFVPTGVTFVKEKLEDEKWNRSLARAVAVTRGKAGYDELVKRLKLFGILSAPLSYDVALSN